MKVENKAAIDLKLKKELEDQNEAKTEVKSERVEEEKSEDYDFDKIWEDYTKVHMWPESNIPHEMN